MYYWCLLLVVTFIPGISFGYTPKMGPSMACFVTDRVWPDTDSFYYCGSQSTGCAGVSQGKHDTPHWYTNGESFNGHYCCGGTNSASGKWVAGSSWETGNSYTVKKDLGGGKTCNQTRIKTICGTEKVKTDCNEPDGCTAGLIFRKVASSSGTTAGTTTGTCVKPCTAGYAFESASSTNCIECPTTNFQGISGENCLKCDPATQFFAYYKGDSARKGRCVNKSDTSIVSSFSKTDLQYGPNQTINTTTVKQSDTDATKTVACWVYSNTDEYKNCVIGSAGISTAVSNTTGNNSPKYLNAYWNGQLVSGGDKAIDDLLSSWDDSKGTLVINKTDGSKTVKTPRLQRKKSN
jgi:hypothetical protein